MLVPLRERRVLVDSSAYLALLDRDDEHYLDALRTLTWLVENRYRQYTTSVLLVECHALIMSTLGNERALTFLETMLQSNTTVIRVRRTDEERARQILRRYIDKDFSYADAISFAVMERLTIREAFTFDRHFVQYGFAPLRIDGR